MMPKLLLIFCLYLMPFQVSAGHGLMNSFGNIEWLPETGLTPDQIIYPVDNWLEQVELFLTSDNSRIRDIYWKFMKEKLAEIVDMTKKKLTSDAKVASGKYLQYLQELSTPPLSYDLDTQAKLDLRLLNNLLEHRYILGIEYSDLPNLHRQEIIGKLIVRIEYIFEKIEERVPRRISDSLFFKKDEVAWIWEIARESEFGVPENVTD